MMTCAYKPLGDAALLVIFGDKISLEINQKVREFTFKVEKKNIDGVVELIPAYADVLIHYNPLIISLKDLLVILKDLELLPFKEQLSEVKTFIVPVCYAYDFAPDMEEVMRINKLSSAEVIQKHSSPKYLVYMLGFTPGFCYLGGMDKRIATPRKKAPRLKISAGAVGIAGQQTGIYPIQSPGGWQIIGQTPIPMFQKDGTEKFPVQQGDCIQFKPISKEEYEDILLMVKTGVYNYEYC